MTSSSEPSPTRALQWYQRVWVWLVAGVAAASLTYGIALVIAASVGAIGAANPNLDDVLLSFGFAAFAFPLIGLWMGALVTRSGTVRGVLVVVTLIGLALAAWAVWNYTGTLEDEAQEACEIVTTADGGIAERDPELCETATDGTVESRQGTVWLVFAGTFVAPLIGLYAFRKRFEPDPSKRLTALELAGWFMVSVGASVTLTLAAIAATQGFGDLAEDLLLTGVMLTVALVTLVAGALLVRRGRERQAHFLSTTDLKPNAAQDQRDKPDLERSSGDT